MDEWLRVLSATLAVFGVVGVGGLLRKLDWLTEAADASLLKLTVNVLLPCLILRSVVGNDALDRAANVWLPPLVGFATITAAILLSGLVAWWLGPKIGLRSPAARRTFAVAVGMHNYGYLPVPLAESLYATADGSTPPVMGVLFVNNVGVDMAMWTVGVAVISGATGLSGWKRAVNAPSIAVVAALLLHAADGGDWLPGRLGFVWQALGMLAACAVPMALVLIGATIVDAFAGLRRDRHTPPPPEEGASPSGDGGGWRLISVACLMRLGLIPAGFVGLAIVLPAAGATAEMQQVLLLHAAMPAAVFPVLLAHHYGGDPPTAARIALATSALSLLTMPAWLALGPGWIGLATP